MYFILQIVCLLIIVNEKSIRCRSRNNNDFQTLRFSYNELKT